MRTAGGVRGPRDGGLNRGDFFALHSGGSEGLQIGADLR